MSEGVPEGWVTCTLGDTLTKIEGGGTPSRTNQEYWAGEIPWATVKDLTAVRLNDASENISEAGLANSSAKLIPSGTIVIATRMAVGKASIFAKDVAINQDLKALYTSASINSEFLLQWYLSNSKKIESLGTGSTVKGITLDTLTALPFELPPLPEQKKIAAILTSVDDVIETTQKQIDKLQDLKKATMNELLTKGIGHTEFKDSELGRIPTSWEVKKLGELGNVVTGSTPSTTNRELYDGNYMFVSPSDISEGMFVSETAKKLSLEGINKTRKIPANSIMVVCIGSTIGKVAISTQECASNQQINTIVPKLNDPYFVYFLIKWMAHLIKKEAGTQAVPLINKTEFSNMFVPLPPRDEQKKIGIALHSINVGIQKLSSKLIQTKSLKKSLMQDLLTGKVRVKVD